MFCKVCKEFISENQKDLLEKSAGICGILIQKFEIFQSGVVFKDGLLIFQFFFRH